MQIFQQYTLSQGKHDFFQLNAQHINSKPEEILDKPEKGSLKKKKQNKEIEHDELQKNAKLSNCSNR